MVHISGKSYRFMAGLPRAGTTLLASVMGQNPDVYVTPQSDLTEHVRVLHQAAPGFESYQLGVMHREQEALLGGLLDAFYSHTPERVIVDKSRRWGAPYFLRLMPTLLKGEEPRILCPIRPLTEVVASFIRKAQENPGSNFIDVQMANEDFLPMWRKPLDDARVDWLLGPAGLISVSMLSVHSALQEDTAHLFHVFSYADLVAEPSKTLDGIYDFLGVDRFQHDFTEIPAAVPHADAEVLGVPDLHAVRPELKVTAPAPDTVLSDYAMTRCMIEDFWTGRV